MARLPPELIDLIFGYLLLDLDGTPNHEFTGVLNLERSTTLLKFGVACRAFYALALPHVYHKFGCDHRGPITPLRVLECFMEQPKQALLIHEFHTEMVENLPREQHQPADRWHPYTRPGPSLQLCTSLISLDIPDKLKQHLYDGLRDGYDDAETAMLLCLCENLRIWKTHTGDMPPQSLTHSSYDDEEDFKEFKDSLPNKVIRGARSPGSRLLQQLFEVHVQFNSPEDPDPYYQTFENVYDILMLPSLRRLTLRRFALWHDFRSNPAVQSTIEYLCLEESWLDASGLVTLLKTCPRLKTLSIHRKDLAVCRPETIYWHPITHSGIGDVLRQDGTNLTMFEWDYDDPGHLQQIGSLASLTSLQTLTIRHGALIIEFFVKMFDTHLKNILPTSLETLNVIMSHQPNNHQSLFISQLPQLMEDHKFERLSKIELRGGHFAFNAADITGWKLSLSRTGAQSLLDDAQCTLLVRE